jgi:hypothetical protein
MTTPDPFHAIHGMPWRTPLLGAFAADQGQSTTARWAPLLSLAVPCSMPQTCPKGRLTQETTWVATGWVRWWVWASILAGEGGARTRSHAGSASEVAAVNAM